MKTKYLFFLGAILCLLNFMSCDKPQLENACENIAVDDTIDSVQILIPNIFTPNGDGVNDYFRPIVSDQKVGAWMNATSYEPAYLSTKISTWGTGEIILETKDPMGWDGQYNGQVVEGLYQYRIDISTGRGAFKAYEGTVYVWRSAGGCVKNANQCIYESNLVGAGAGAVDPFGPIGC